MALAISLITMIALMVFRKQLPLMFTDDPIVISIAAQLFIFAGLYQISDGLQTILVGILRGIQDVSVLMRYAFISYIVINLPVGYLCAFVLGIGAPGLWIGSSSDSASRPYSTIAVTAASSPSGPYTPNKKRSRTLVSTDSVVCILY